MQDPGISELFDAFAEDLLSEHKARPLIIVGASKIDHLLLEVLRRFLLPKNAKPKDQDELLEGDTPLATFGARVKMCRRLGLINETLYLALEQLRVLRNLAAHSVSFDIAKSPAREHLGEVRKRIAERESYAWTRQTFLDPGPLKPTEELQCLLLTACVLLEAIREKVSRTEGNKSALSIAAK